MISVVRLCKCVCFQETPASRFSLNQHTLTHTHTHSHTHTHTYTHTYTHTLTHTHSHTHTLSHTHSHGVMKHVTVTRLYTKIIIINTHSVKHHRNTVNYIQSKTQINPRHSVNESCQCACVRARYR